jgi:hypothetical protein
MQNPNPKPKSIKPQVEIVEFLGDEKFKSASVEALKYFVSLLSDYLGTQHEHYEPHYHVKINGSEITVRYMRILRVVATREYDLEKRRWVTRRRVEKVYWRVRAHVSVS